MSPRALLAIGTSLALAACATTPDPADPPTATAADESSFSVDGTGAPSAPAPAPLPALGAEELALWNDPAFKRRFIESYVAETETEPRVTITEREDMEEILALISSEKVDKAIALLEKSRGPAGNAVFDYTRANLHFQAEELPAAAKAYEIAVDKYPKFRRAWLNLGLVHFREGRYEDAVQALTKVIEQGVGDAVTFGMLGYSYSNLGNHLSAESAYRMAILLDPVLLDWKMGLARSLFGQSRFADAAALCKSLIDENPDRAELWTIQAQAHIGLERPLAAAQDLEVVDELGASTVDGLCNLGDIYVNGELFDLSVGAYARALALDAHGAHARSVRAARALIARGALSETRALMDLMDPAVEADLGPDDKRSLLKLRASLALAEGAGEEQARILEELLLLDPLDGGTMVQLGHHYRKSGDPDRAIFYFERAAELEAVEADAKVGHAQVLVGVGKYEEALPLLRRAQALNERESIQSYLDHVERIAKNR